jgi:hypothetical protein
MNINSDQIRRDYDRDGFVQIHQLFSPEEVEGLRAACASYGSGDILSKPEFSLFPFDDKILTLVRSMIGERVVYFGESTALNNAVAETPEHRHYHNDSRGDDFDFIKDYKVIRLGVYLQDHARHSGGLKLRPGSHRKFCFEKFGLKGAVKHLLRRHRPQDLVSRPSLNVATRPGDLLGWNMRIHHTGYALRLRSFPNLALHPRVENLLPASAFLPEEKGRCVIFMSFGAPGADLENYIRDRITRDDMKAYWKNTSFSQEAKDLARAKGIELRTDGAP